MFTPRVLREAENASSTYSHNKPLTSEQKLPKMKAKALGDVQNTLHSRPSNFVLSERSPAVKIPGKSSVHTKSTSDEKGLSVKSITSGNKLYSTPLKIPGKSFSSKQIGNKIQSEDDVDLLEIHNHVLCEQEEKSFMNDYFSEFQFSDQQIENLVRSVKISVMPVPVKTYEPCEDIVIPDDKKSEENNFSLSDIFDDIIVPNVPPPVMVL